MYTESDLFFPNSSIQNLRNLRGEGWQQLIDRLAPLPDNHEEIIAFILMVAQLNKCFVCQTDSFRALRGCLVCLQQTLKRFSGSDEMLIEMYDCALDSVRNFADQPSPVADMIIRTESGIGLAPS